MVKKLPLSLCALMLLSSIPLVSSAQVLRPDLMFCGSTTRTGSDLYIGVGPFNEVSACTPDANTQALLVSRSGTVSGNGADWLAYLNAGGVLITEWRNAADVYNEIYGTAYGDGTGFGDCWDNAMPSLKLNTDHQFWVDNAGLLETPETYEGCGIDLSAVVVGESEVTALGGLVNTAFISFAVRPQGSGVFWVLEADWQDSDAGVTEWNSGAFMGSLISGGTYGTGFEETVPVPTLSTLGLLLLILAFAAIGVRRKVRT